MKKIALYTALAIATVTTSGTVLAARDYISIVGSSTVYPFTTVVAERFGKATGLATPKVESTGTGGGMKLFCSGVGESTPDMTNASRAIKPAELLDCQKNGVTEVIEMKVGYDGIVFANSKSVGILDLTQKEIFLALGKIVPNKDGNWVPNPYKTWNEINSAFPKTKIEVLGPPPTSGTRDAFVELVLDVGAGSIEALAKLGKMTEAEDIKGQLLQMGLSSMYAEQEAKLGKAPVGADLLKVLAQTVREDGVYIEAGENDNLIVQKLNSNPNAYGIFGYSFLEENMDTIKGNMIQGVAPEFESIAKGTYKVSRPLFVYVKKAHIGVIPGMKEFLAEFTSEKAWGEDGYLSDKGLIPMPTEERAKYKESVDAMKAMPAI